MLSIAQFDIFNILKSKQEGVRSGTRSEMCVEYWYLLSYHTYIRIWVYTLISEKMTLHAPINPILMTFLCVIPANGR